MTVLFAVHAIDWKKYRQKYRQFVGILLDTIGWDGQLDNK